MDKSHIILTNIFRHSVRSLSVFLIVVVHSMCPVFDSSSVSNTSASIASSFSSSPKPLIPKVITMSSLETSSSSSRSFARGRVAGHVAELPAEPPEPGSTLAVALEADIDAESAKSVWDFDHVSRSGTCKADHQWKCLWCNQTFRHWNATKVLYHLAKVTGKDVRICKASHDKKSQELYWSFVRSKEKASSGMEARAEALSQVLGEGQQSLAVMFEASRQRISNGGGTATATAQQRVRSELTVEASTASKLTMAIADFVHSSGLPFSSTQGDYFKNILRLARGVPSTYKAPSRNAISTTLLKLNYNRRIEK